MGLPPRLAQIATIAMASVAGGTLIAVEGTRSGRSSEPLEPQRPRIRDRMGFFRDAPPPRKQITHTHLPEPVGKRAKRRAKGRAK